MSAKTSPWPASPDAPPDKAAAPPAVLVLEEKEPGPQGGRLSLARQGESSAEEADKEKDQAPS